MEMKEREDKATRNMFWIGLVLYIILEGLELLSICIGIKSLSIFTAHEYPRNMISEWSLGYNANISSDSR